MDGSLNVATVNPKIDFYKDDPTLGTVWEKQFQMVSRLREMKLLQAAPYFISPKEFKNSFFDMDLVFEWSNRLPCHLIVVTLLPLQLQNGIHGTSQIGLEVSNIHSLVNTASKEINVNF